MIDDAFLRQTAALQANLKMLESQQDALSDFQDMQALRLYKARLSDYIEAHSKAGHLPPDPFHVIQQRLVAVSKFFTAADQEYQRLTSWKKSWIKGVPNISLSDIQSARAELSNLVAEFPHVQERLRQMLLPLDWDTSSSTVDLHPELLACVQCVDRLILRSKDGSRHDLYQFSRDEGKLAKGVSTHLTAMCLRIEELIALHVDHVKALAETDHHLSNDSFRSAEKSFQNLGVGRFSDVNYSLVESRLRKAIGVLAQFTSLDSSLKQLLEKGEYKAVKAELSQLHRLVEKPDSELGREASALLQKMDSRFAAAQKAHKKRMVTRVAFISLFIAGLGAFSLYVVKENAKAEEARVIALAQAEIEAAEAKLGADREAVEAKAKLLVEIDAGRVGVTLGVPLAGKVVMPFAFCPSGFFTMGRPASEEGRSGDERQVSVTLSKGFWMAKTEVTQAQWQAVMGNNPSSDEGDDLPVENVSWDDAQEFIKKVNGSGMIPDGWRMALPTEAQWEYACRAGVTGTYSGGTIEQVAWYDGNSASKTHDVGTKKANTWGLHDMHGNVWEWCADWYDDTLPGGMDPSGPSSGVHRVCRGGSWRNDAAYCSAAYRSWYDPGDRDLFLGFRPALVVSNSQTAGLSDLSLTRAFLLANCQLIGFGFSFFLSR